MDTLDFDEVVGLDVLYFKPNEVWGRIAAMFLHFHDPSPFGSHVGLGLRTSTGGYYVLEFNLDGVFLYPEEKCSEIFEVTLAQRLLYSQPVQESFVAPAWVEEIVSHCQWLGVHMTVLDCLRWSLGHRENNLVCTGFVQHCLILPVTNPTPRELCVQLSIEFNKAELEHGQR